MWLAKDAILTWLCHMRSLRLRKSQRRRSSTMQMILCASPPVFFLPPNVGIAIINNPFFMIYTTHSWWLRGWFIIATPRLQYIQCTYTLTIFNHQTDPQTTTWGWRRVKLETLWIRSAPFSQKVLMSWMLSKVPQQHRPQLWLPPLLQKLLAETCPTWVLLH